MVVCASFPPIIQRSIISETTDLYDIKEAHHVTLTYNSTEWEMMYRCQFEEELRKDGPIEYCTALRFRLVKVSSFLNRKTKNRTL